MKGNCITIRYYVMSFVLGPTYVKYDYIYKNGSLCRKSNTVNIEKVYAGGKITKVFIVNKKLTTYKSVSGNTKAYTLKKGKAVLVDKCYCNGKSLWVRLKYKGKYGWLKAVNGYKGENNKQFSNVTYAG